MESQKSDLTQRKQVTIVAGGEMKSSDAQEVSHVKLSRNYFDTRNFIKRVQAYPEIFDTNNPGFKQADDKNGAWDKLAEEFNVNANFCKKRFRTLRERYTRELRKSYLEPSTPVRYDYFKDLEFLAPYIKFRSIAFETSEGKTVVTKREDISMIEKDSQIEDIQEQEAFYEETEPNHVYIQDSENGQSLIYETSVQPVEYPEPSSQVHEVVRHHPEEEEHLNPVEKKRKRDWNDIDENDDDKFFAMSVACSLKRLTTINNLKAKVEIYQVLERFTSKQQQENENRK